MIYIGIDTSTTNTAVVVLDSQKNMVRHILLSPKSKDILQRSAEIVRDVLSYVPLTCSSLKHLKRDCVIGIEGGAYMAVGQRDKLTMLTGAIFYGLCNNGFDVKLMPPSTIKKQFTGNGRAKKEQVIERLPDWVKDDFEVGHKKIDDLADAFAIASIL